MSGSPQRSEISPVAREPAPAARVELSPVRGRVLPFPWRRARPPGPAPHDPDDYTLSRLQIFGFAVFLALFVTFGVWLLEAMRAQAKLEECLMAGRKNCLLISVPLAER